MKAVLYCGKGKSQLVKSSEGKYGYELNETPKCLWELKENEQVEVNDKICVECDFDVEEIIYNAEGLPVYTLTKSKYDDFVSKGVSVPDVVDCFNQSNGYAIHLNNIEVFEEPRNLRYYHSEPDLICLLDTAPRTMKYCYDFRLETVDDSVKSAFKKCVIINVSPEEMYRIVTGKQLVILRRTVLKEMLEPTDAERQ